MVELSKREVVIEERTFQHVAGMTNGLPSRMACGQRSVDTARIIHELYTNYNRIILRSLYIARSFRIHLNVFTGKSSTLSCSLERSVIIQFGYLV